MKAVSLCFPHQLFLQNPVVMSDIPLYIIEDNLFFGDLQYPFQFHKQKLIFLRAALQAYFQYQRKAGIQVEYVPYDPWSSTINTDSSITELFTFFAMDHITDVHLVEVIDYELNKRLKSSAKEIGINLHHHPSPSFLINGETLEKYLRKDVQLDFIEFYKDQRKQNQILLDNDKPQGGRWIYSVKKFETIPPNTPQWDLVLSDSEPFIEEAIQYVCSKFPNNPGEHDIFNFPVTHEDAQKWLSRFLNEFLPHYHQYQKNLSQTNHFLYHSRLSPLLNIGLLTPQEVLSKIIDVMETEKLSVKQVEPFIRNILGKREFSHLLYKKQGIKLRTKNFWNHEHPMPHALYTGSTGIFPVDNLIKSLLETGYLHHAERWLILGNFLMLCEIHPDAIYQWFMELFIDGFDWITVPNVYGFQLNFRSVFSPEMSILRDSKSILDHSDFPKGEWCELWDSLYWRFISKHQRKLAQLADLKPIVVKWKMTKPKEKTKTLAIANQFLVDLREEAVY